MAVSLRPQYDMTLTVNGKDYGYQLWEDPNGQKHWNEGLAPLITPQQRISEFSYEHIPPEIDLPAAFEDWSLGSGYTEFRSTQQLASGFYQLNSNTPKVYNYSQGVDASWSNRIYMSPLRNITYASTGGDLASTPSFFYSSVQFGLWCVAGIYLYKYDLSSKSWVLKYTAAAAITSLAEVSGVLYVSITGSAYVYSTNGNTWTAFSDANLNSANIADYFTVRSNVLMAMRSEKAYVTTNGQNSGVTWSAGTAIGNTSETTKSVVVADNVYWIFKTQAIYTWDGTTVSQVWSPDYIESDNGTSAFVWYDGNIYTVYGSRILAIDPFNTQESSLRFVFPGEANAKNGNPDAHDSVEIKGTISQVTGTFSDMYFTVTNPNGNTYLMKGSPSEQIWHTVAYLGAIPNTACIAVGPGVAHPQNPAILVTYNNTVAYYILPRSDLRPEDDVNYRYESTGTIYGPWMGFGARAFNKYLNRGTILGTDITAGQNIVLGYQLDDNDSTTHTLLTAIDYGSNTKNVLSTVSFYRIRYVITLNSASNTTTPIMTAATLHSTMNPPRRRIWKPIINLRQNQLLRDATEDRQDVTELRNALYAAASQRITMTDRENNSYVVRVLDIIEQAISFSAIGGNETDNQVLQISLAEISPISSKVQPAKYGQARYNQGYGYA